MTLFKKKIPLIVIQIDYEIIYHSILFYETKHVNNFNMNMWIKKCLFEPKILT